MKFNNLSRNFIPNIPIQEYSNQISIIDFIVLAILVDKLPGETP